MILLMLLLIILIVLVLAAIFHAISLWLAAKVVGEDKGFKVAFATSIAGMIVGGLCMLIPIPILNLLIAIVAQLFIIKAFYDTSWGNAAFMWIISVIIQVVVVFIILFLVFGAAFVAFMLVVLLG